MKHGSQSVPLCLQGECECTIATQLKRSYEASCETAEAREDVTRLVRKLFNCLGILVNNGIITGEAQLGQSLGAIFDFCLSLLYAERCANTKWLYCPSEPPIAFYPYIRSCPRCGRSLDLPSIAHKPSSDSIGRYTSLCIAAMLSEICRRTRNGWQVRLIASSRGEIDLILHNPYRIALCEIKASPLVAFPLCKIYDEALDREVNGENQRVESHIATDVSEWKKQRLGLFIPVVNRCIPVRVSKRDGGEITLIPSLLHRKRSDLVEDLKAVIILWQQLFEGYSTRWERYSDLRWHTFGCGGGVDDSKNAPGLDRTDDIKKGLYQSLKLVDSYRMACVQRRISVGIVSNLHPVTHYEEYLRGFADAVWTHEGNLHKEARSSEWKRVRSSDLAPFYDMLFTLTNSWFRDLKLERAFRLTRLYRALGGK